MLQLTKISLFIVVVLIAACTKPESPAEESTAGEKDLWLETFARQTSYKHLYVNIIHLFFGLFSIIFLYF